MEQATATILGMRFLGIDSNGDAIHVQVDARSISAYRPLIIEGALYILSNFQVGTPRIQLIAMRSTLMIWLTRTSLMEPVDHDLTPFPRHWFDFASETQLNRLANTNRFLTVREPIEARRRPLLTEVLRKNLKPANCDAYILQQPHIQSAMYTNGLANFVFPELNINTANPTPQPVDLTAPSNNYKLNSDEEVVYLFQAEDILQVQLMIYTYRTINSRLLAYQLRFKIGTENSLVHHETVAEPFQAPTNFTALYYNARGAALPSFRAHLLELVDEYHLMVIIITETRLGAGDANPVASILQ
ncbi:hypothetical protein CCACVL1_17513 [Corchorus capsularis]|uniref:Uncharacterized protein n=1 Tax=Corchorus capsularis TaxID=210143 RepID=A0A1R3HRA8_COCAP|nr:hypothetical protein CCACVL1_17513 [Corchorus capsularis]